MALIFFSAPKLLVTFRETSCASISSGLVDLSWFARDCSAAMNALTNLSWLIVL